MGSGSLALDGRIGIFQEDPDPGRCGVASVEFEYLGGGRAESALVVGDPLAEFTGIHPVLDLRQGEQGASTNPGMDGFVVEQSPDVISGQLHPVFAEIVEGFGLLNPTLALELL
jgi:hypothetical protein